jgi:hypothetical protein
VACCGGGRASVETASDAHPYSCGLARLRNWAEVQTHQYPAPAQLGCDLRHPEAARGIAALLGRGVRLWDGLEGLEKDYQVEATSSPSGVTHVTFTRVGA